jgi:hypothetical protein
LTDEKETPTVHLRVMSLVGFVGAIIVKIMYDKFTIDFTIDESTKE